MICLCGHILQTLHDVLVKLVRCSVTTKSEWRGRASSNGPSLPQEWILWDSVEDLNGVLVVAGLGWECRHALLMFISIFLLQVQKKFIFYHHLSPIFSSLLCFFHSSLHLAVSWKKWLPTPVFLPGEPHGQRSLVGYSPWGHRETDTTEQLNNCIF